MAITSLTRWDGGELERVKSLATRAKAHLMRFGAESVTLSRTFTGPHVGTLLVAIRWPDWAAYGKGTAAMAASAEYQAIMAEVTAISRRVDHTLQLGIEI